MAELTGKQITLITDAGVNLITGESKCGIIIKDDKNKVELSVAVPYFTEEGATDAEMLSVGVGLDVLEQAKKTDRDITIINDNKDTIQSAIESPNFKGTIGKNGWGRSKMWEKTIQFSNLKAEWSGDDTGRNMKEKIQVGHCNHLQRFYESSLHNKVLA